MKKSLLILTIVLSISIISAIAGTVGSPTEDTNVTGKWALVADAGGQSLQIGVELKQTGTDFSGTTASDMGNGVIDGGKVSGKTITGTLHADVQGSAVDFKIDGTVEGDKMTGTFTNASFGSIPFTATKSK